MGISIGQINGILKLFYVDFRTFLHWQSISIHTYRSKGEDNKNFLFSPLHIRTFSLSILMSINTHKTYEKIILLCESNTRKKSSTWSAWNFPTRRETRIIMDSPFTDLSTCSIHFLCYSFLSCLLYLRNFSSKPQKYNPLTPQLTDCHPI